MSNVGLIVAGAEKLGSFTTCFIVGGLYVVAWLVLRVVSQIVAKAKAVRFGKGEVELRFHDTLTDR